MFLGMSQAFVNIVFISKGALETDGSKIAGIGLGIMVSNMLVTAPSFGLNSALETFVSQSFGSGDLILCGDYLNRGRSIFIIYFLIVLTALLNAKEILIAVG